MKKCFSYHKLINEVSLALYGFLDSHISIKVIKFKLEESALIGNFLETMLALFIQKIETKKRTRKYPMQ